MPRTISGLAIGTMFCGYAAAVQWRAPKLTSGIADHDTVECFVILGVPIFPFKAFHTFGWSGTQCQAFQIRRTGDLLLRAMLRPYTLVLLGLGVFYIAICALALTLALIERRGIRWQNVNLYLQAFFIGAFVSGLLLRNWLERINRRNRDIRLILGPHEFGSSDPATWLPETLVAVKSNRRLFGTEDAYQAVQDALQEGRFAEAIMAARLAVGRGELWGEEMTDKILADYRLIENLPKLRKKPWLRPELLPQDVVPSLDPRVADPGQLPVCYRNGTQLASAEDGAVFYDNHCYCNACLDACGGPGFAEAVRKEPVLIRRAPSHWFIRAVLGLVLLIFCTVAIQMVVSPRPGESRWQNGLGGLGVVAIFGILLYRTCRRKVVLGNGELRISRAHLPVTDIRGLRYGRFCFVEPIIEAFGSNLVVDWPKIKDNTDDIERALRAAIALRTSQSVGTASQQV